MFRPYEVTTMDETESNPESNDDMVIYFTNEVTLRRRSPPLFLRVKGENVVQLVGFASQTEALPIHRLLVMVLLIVLRDHATTLTFEPQECEEKDGQEADKVVGFRMLYEVEGQSYDLVPPPPHLRRAIAREIESVTGMRSLSGRLAHGLCRLANKIQGFDPAPRWGQFRVALGDIISHKAEVWSWRVALGDIYQVRFTPVTKEISDGADQELRTLLRLINEKKANERTETDVTG
jgi:hypothetical protein